MGRSKFYEEICNAADERGVEATYHKGLCMYFPNSEYTYPFKSDGYMEVCEEGKTFRLLIEYKLDELLNNNAGRAKVLIQVVWYLKQFELDGRIIPNVCLVGDKNECFALHTNPLLKYLDENVDWNIAPSQAHTAYPDVVLKIANDGEICPFVFAVDDNFSFKTVIDKIRDIANNTQRYVRVTEHNISNIFDYFCKNVLKGKAKLSGHDLVGVFMGVLNDQTNYYQHPTNPNILVANGDKIPMDGSAFKSFFGYFDRNYTPQEKNRMTAIADRLIADVERRMKGDFWTPTLFVDYAHKMIEDALGENWRDAFVVWDNCWGTGNLTRDYFFKELYCSTLFQSELDMGGNYNKEAVKFQFDFLNDYIPMKGEALPSDSKMPKGLMEAFEQDKPIVFFLNPPYGTANNMGTSGTSKEGIAKSSVNLKMGKANMGACSEQLYAQFLYRILLIKQAYSLTNCHIALYSPTLFLTGPSWKRFRELFLKEFAYISGCQFKASNFADVSDNWGISFSLWKCGNTTDKENFVYDLIDDVNGEIQIFGVKTVYNIDNELAANDWAKEPVKKLKAYDAPQISSGVVVKEKGVGTIVPNALGYFGSNSNNVDMNTMYVSLYSGASSRAHGYSVIPENFTRCTALFSARKLVNKSWINSKDEYIAPDIFHPLYQEFENDSIVFSLFHSSSNQSSLRNIEYNGKVWNIYNEFFFMDKDEIMQLAEANNFDGCYNDARTAKQRFVYLKLQGLKLSKEAKTVLDKAVEIVRNTFPYRELFNSAHPEYQVMNWDCGWYQIKAMAKEYDSANYNEFLSMFRWLGDKMLPMVYQLGFLK